MRHRAGALAGALLLVASGLLLDRAAEIPQPLLWVALQLASGLGVVLGGVLVAPAFASRAARIVLVGVLLLAWRVAYFPIMVFSGHVASIAEWLELIVGVPIAIWPVFLLSVAAIHALAAVAAGWLLRPPHPLLRVVLVPAFAVAVAVSFSNASDLTLLPDRSVKLGAPVPATREARANPYFRTLGAPEYRWHQNAMLLAAALTYETIPESPWARTVKAVLEGLFHENPVGSTQDRVVEHYRAYHAAQRMVGCRDLAQCPAEPTPAASQRAASR